MICRVGIKRNLGGSDGVVSCRGTLHSVSASTRRIKERKRSGAGVWLLCKFTSERQNASVHGQTALVTRDCARIAHSTVGRLPSYTLTPSAEARTQIHSNPTTDASKTQKMTGQHAESCLMTPEQIFSLRP